MFKKVAAQNAAVPVGIAAAERNASQGSREQRSDKMHFIFLVCVCRLAPVAATSTDMRMRFLVLVVVLDMV